MTDPVTGTAAAKAVEATAKATDKALTVIHDTGGYLREVVGDLPRNAVALLGGDWIGQKRIRNLDAMMRRTEAILRERNAQPIDQLSPNLATELLSGAQDESREELIELWARLLANGLDPKLNTVRHSYIEAVNKMDAPDAIILDCLRMKDCREVLLGKVPYPQNGMGTADIATEVNFSVDGVQVSIEHLTALGVLFTRDNNRWYFTATGREFLRACYPERPIG